MKIKITKKVKQELKSIIDNKGYWDNAVEEYISQFDFVSRSKLLTLASAYNSNKEASILNQI